jgi:hypothetical protein
MAFGSVKQTLAFGIFIFLCSNSGISKKISATCDKEPAIIYIIVGFGIYRFSFGLKAKIFPHSFGAHKPLMAA